MVMMTLPNLSRGTDECHVNALELCALMAAVDMHWGGSVQDAAAGASSTPGGHPFQL